MDDYNPSAQNSTEITGDYNRIVRSELRRVSFSGNVENRYFVIIINLPPFSSNTVSKQLGSGYEAFDDDPFDEHIFAARSRPYRKDLNINTECKGISVISKGDSFEEEEEHRKE